MLKDITSPQISLIIPVYNAEKYLQACLNSILLQTFHDYEVVIINDGSTDKSADIAERFATLDKRFSVYHQQNAGVTSARRKGIDNAHGNYVFFLDSDDTLPNTALEQLSKYTNKNWDIIIGQWQDLLTIRINESISIDEYRKRLIFSKMQVGACGKLVKRELFLESVLALPRDIKVGEDWIMHLRLSFNTEKDVLIIPNKVYCYNLNEGSVTCTFKHNIEYARKFYPHLVESVPPELTEKYTPLITNAVINRWLVYTSAMLRLSDFSIEFLDELKIHYRRGFEGLNILNKLLFLNSKNFLRLPLLGMYHVWQYLLPILKKLVHACRNLKHTAINNKN